MAHLSNRPALSFSGNAARPVFALLMVVWQTCSLGAEVVSQHAGPYCGIYNLYAAFRTLDIPANFESLLQSDYVDSPLGSTIKGLQSAAKMHGCHAIALGRLSTSSLQGIRFPMLLNVASFGQLDRYDHWVMCLGIEHGELRIFDFPGPSRLIPAADVLARWNGITLIIVPDKADSQNTLNYLEFAFTDLLMYLCEGMAAILALRLLLISRHWARLRTPESWSGRLRREALSLISIAGVLSFSVQLIDKTSFYYNRDALAYVITANAKHAMPSLGVNEVVSIVNHNQGILIDARHVSSYQSGHIDGAINIPVDASEAEIRALIKGINADAQLVVYCESLTCNYDEAIALKLACLGFTNIKIYSGGWRDWNASNK